MKNSSLLPSRIFPQMVAVGLSLMYSASLSHAVLYDFNTTSQLADAFNKGTTSGSGTGSLTNASDGGLSNSGSLAIPTAVGNDSFLYTTKASVSATFTTINVFTYFQASAATISGNALTLTIGLVDASPATTTTGTSAVGIPDAASANSFTLSLRNAGSDTGSGLSYNLSSYNNAATVGSPSSSVTLIANGWYMLEAAYTYSGSGNYSLTGQIYASNNAGVISGSGLITTGNTWSATNTGLADGNTYFLLSSQNGNRRGLGRVDNYGFEAVPEPTTALLAGAGLMVLLFRRGRRRMVIG